MYEVLEYSCKWAGDDLTIQTGAVARQADGSVVISHGNTKLLCTVMVEKTPKDDCGFLPLTVNFFSKSYAFGKIPSGFFKREGKQSEQEILISRIIDRSIRPLLNSKIRNSIHVVCMLLSHDFNNPIEPVCVMAASLVVSMVFGAENFRASVAAVNMVCEAEDWVINSQEVETKNIDSNVVISGTQETVCMVEMCSTEISSESIMQALKSGHALIMEAISFMDKFLEAYRASDNFDSEVQSSLMYQHEPSDDLKEKFDAFMNDEYFKLYETDNKKQLTAKQRSYHKDMVTKLLEDGYDQESIESSLEQSLRQKFRERTLTTGKRIDGRAYNQIREISIQNDVLYGAHGSSLFTRGNTQALVTTTLGTTQDEQITDSLDGDNEKRERFMMHYNFPPFSVGDVTSMRISPGRREIGHGRLAGKALMKHIPGKDVFPYSIRVVSEITESDGSSSMATVCGASLSLMDAGIPIKGHIAGIAMGMIHYDQENVLLSDISGIEDGFGDMDLKVTGTANGITALQMDIKVSGITFESIAQTLAQAREGINIILEKMNSCIADPREHPKDIAPSIKTITIDKSKIKDVIGGGGKNIREICEISGAKIDVEQSGGINISAPTASKVAVAEKMIYDIISDPIIGETYDCTISKITHSGLCVTFMGGRQGFLYANDVDQKAISAVEIGVEFQAKLISAQNERYKFSMKRKPVRERETSGAATGGEVQAPVSARENFRKPPSSYTQHHPSAALPNAPRDPGGNKSKGDSAHYSTQHPSIRRSSHGQERKNISKPHAAAPLGHAYRRRAMSGMYSGNEEGGNNDNFNE